MRLYETAEELGFQRGSLSLSIMNYHKFGLTIHNGGHLFLGYIPQYLLSVALYLQSLFGRPLEMQLVQRFAILIRGNFQSNLFRYVSPFPYFPTLFFF